MSDLDGRGFYRRGSTLVAADIASEDFLSEIPEGKEVLVTIRRARSPEHHRWFFKLLSRVAENSDKWADVDDLLDDLKLACGHYTRRANILTGQIQYVPKSISFAAMGEDKFKRFKERALYVLTQALGYDPIILMEGETEPTRHVPAPPIAPRPIREREAV
jgi:hypothetical protein